MQENLAIINSSGSICRCNVQFARKEPWCIIFECIGFDSQRFEGNDLFDCLVKLRRHLEKQDCLILCNGSRIDVYPSGMSRQMSGGRVAYIMKIGEVTKSGDIVDIFEPADKTLVSTVEQQKEYHSRWVASIMKM